MCSACESSQQSSELAQKKPVMKFPSENAFRANARAEPKLKRFSFVPLSITSQLNPLMCEP